MCIRDRLSEFENEERYFQVMLPSATSLAKGKKMVLMNTLNTSELWRSLIACVDSDYDFLLQCATKVSHRICLLYTSVMSRKPSLKEVRS